LEELLTVKNALEAEVRDLNSKLLQEYEKVKR
jgi:hypothetical protein